MSVRSEIVGIQHLRGIAAIAVVMCHVEGTASQAKFYGRHLLGAFFPAAQIGADLFFVISGFILAAVSLDGPALAPAISRRGFFERRFARVVPLMWVAILAYAALRIAGTGFADWPGYVHALLLSPFGMVLPTHIWTLRAELLFYLLFAFAMLGRRPRWWVFALWVAVSAAVHFAIPLTAALGLIGHEGWSTPPWLTLRILFAPASFEFVAGMVIAVLLLRRGGRRGVRLPVDPFVVLALGFAAVIAIEAVFDMRIVFAPVWTFAIVAMLAGLVWLGVHVECPPGPIERLGRLLGDASYSIYLFHPPIVSVALLLAGRFARGAPMGLVVAAIVAAAVAGGIVIHFMLERPLVSVVRRRFSTRPVSIEASPARPLPSEPAPH